MLLDCGPGVLPRLRAQDGWPRVDAIVITHFHLDHWGDLVPWTFGAMYGPGRDTPKFGDDSGPHCYPVPFAGVALHDGTTPGVVAPPVRAGTREPAADPSTTVGTLGLPNSPAENEFVNELVAPSVNRPPQALPDWSSVLVGPAFRGTEVTLK